MAHYRNNGELFIERRGIVVAVFNSLGKSCHGSRVLRRGRRFGRFTKHRLPHWVFFLTTLFSISLTVYGLKLFFQAKIESSFSMPDNLQQEQNLQENILVSDVGRSPKSKHRKQQYVDQEEKLPGNDLVEPRFGGHQTLKERKKSFYANNQTLHCGFVKGPLGYLSTGFDLNEKDTAYMFSCKVVVSSCIFGSSDFLRRPTSRLISQYSKDNVCLVMFLDDQTLSKLSSEGNNRDDRGFIGLWKVVTVKNLPYDDMRRTGKVPKFLSQCLFPNARYLIWLDSKMRLNSDRMLMIEYFLWLRNAEYAISNHYDRHCVWEEDFERRASVKLFRHKTVPSPPDTA
ncbi:hypothetical protein TanjilG_13949 [Lupinus angustifolius]|uniref:TOD1/MUCI70 glycosyltransferase-like domain-containing protein n=1 Tax=Lupinus angustifolius TaxID=3871 RepID=A0A1J7IV83_LUPAN|nr:hypothetical protein TanjilG_13949 [Lupinus angustifolius]